MSEIHAPTVSIDEPTLLHAHVREGRWLCVYRSLIVKDTDPQYEPVYRITEFLEPVIREVVTDPDMWFGKAESLTYDLGVLTRGEP